MKEIVTVGTIGRGITKRSRKMIESGEISWSVADGNKRLQIFQTVGREHNQINKLAGVVTSLITLLVKLKPDLAPILDDPDIADGLLAFYTINEIRNG